MEFQVEGKLFLLNAPTEKRFQKSLDIAVEDLMKIAHLKSRARILDPLVRMQKIIADL